MAGSRQGRKWIVGAFLVRALLVWALLQGLPARAGHEETEARLKTAGVKTPLRERIHQAIADSSQWLVRRQNKDGGFRGRAKYLTSASSVSGYTALAGLALAHADTPDAVRASDRAIRYLVPAEHRVKSGIFREVYTAGLTNMLLKARDRHPKVARAVTDHVAFSMEKKSGWWGYYTHAAGDTPSTDFANLSTTQFAALALWSGARTGGDVPAYVWRKHLRSLCRLQIKSGGWTYMPSRVRSAGYPNGTFMGIANTVLARAALADDLRYDPRLAACTELALRRAEQALALDARKFVTAAGSGRAGAPWAPYYGFYALEKACVFLELEELRGYRWYVEGAKALLDMQNADGGWGGTGLKRGPGAPRRVSRIGATAFGLLFLLRVSETYRPTTPRDVRLRVTTPSSASGKPPSPHAKPVVLKEPVPLSDAERAVDRLRKALRRVGATNRDLVQAIDDVEAALARLVPDPLPADLDPGAIFSHAERQIEREQEFRAQAARRLLRVLAKHKVDKPRRRDDLEPTRLRAVRALARAGRAVETDLRNAIRRHVLAVRDHEPTVELHRAAFETLGRIGGEDSLRWIATEVVSAQDERAEVIRTWAAVRSLPHYRGISGIVRRRVVSSLVKSLGPLRLRAAAGAPDPADTRTAQLHWDLLRVPLLDGLVHLATDPETGEPPTNEDGRPLTGLPAFEAWLPLHGKTDRPPWRD